MRYTHGSDEPRIGISNCTWTAPSAGARYAVYAPDDPRRCGFLFDTEEAARNYMAGLRPDLVLERRDPDGTTTRLA